MQVNDWLENQEPGRELKREAEEDWGGKRRLAGAFIRPIALTVAKFVADH
jgi:hypothetical protein